jgi:hypothetical protein
VGVKGRRTGMKKRIKVLFQVLCIKTSLLGVISDFLKKLIDDKEGKFLEQFKKFLRGELVEKPVSYIIDTYYITTNYDRSIDDFVEFGNYDWINEDINDQNFPKIKNHQVDGEKTFSLFYFNYSLSSESVISAMKAENYRPATMRELLIFGENNPEIQRKFPIVALGQENDSFGDRRVGYLDGSLLKRIIDLFFFNRDWDNYCRFLAVRN